MDFRKLTPHLIAAAILLAVSCIFFAPNVFSGKALAQPDNDKARAMQTEIMAYKSKTGEIPLWTNSAFGGMPTYQIYSPARGNWTIPLARMLYLGQGISSVWAFVFAAMLCMYVFLMVLRLDWRVAIFGALAYGITTYNVDILEAGHSTKMSALALAPGMLAGTALLMRGRYWLGGGLLALFTGFQINANHPQITYYTLIVLGIYFLTELVWAFRHSGMANWGLRAGAFVLAVSIGVATNVSSLWPTWEYGQETIRGISDLPQKAAKGDGLDRDYLFGWSYGIAESMTLLVPHAYGGGAGEKIDNTETLKFIAKNVGAADRAQLARQLTPYYYYGDQPFVGTAIYMGAIIVFMFFLGAFLVPGVEKWWLLTAGVFSLTLAWGGNFFLNHFFYDYLPMFNKFRAVSMALGITQLCAAGLAALGLQKLFDEDISKEKKLRALYFSLGTIAVLMLAYFLLASGGSGKNDQALASQIKAPGLITLLEKDRSALARSDAFRSLGFILAAAALIWLYLQGRIKAAITVFSVAGLSLMDNWLVCTRTLTADKYQNKRESVAPPKPSASDLQIQKDTDPHYRVLDMAKGSLTTNYQPSFFHKSLGGYHAAKLQRFQEVIDSVFNLGQNIYNVAGMFNAKYIVVEEGQVMPNPRACGHAWFVKGLQILPSGEAELKALRKLNPRDTAIITEKYAFKFRELKIQPDSTASIKLTSYHPDKMEYEYSCSTEQLAIFPEIYYPEAKGWHCYINGERKEGIMGKFDYLLRGAVLPPGQNMKFEMRFEPRSFYVGETISKVASILALLLFFSGLYFFYKSHSLGEANRLTEIEPAPEAEKPKRAPVAENKKPETKRRK